MVEYTIYEKGCAPVNSCMFIQQLFLTRNKGTIKTPHYQSLLGGGGSTHHHSIHLKKVWWSGTYFNVMTLSCIINISNCNKIKRIYLPVMTTCSTMKLPICNNGRVNWSKLIYIQSSFSDCTMNPTFQEDTTRPHCLPDCSGKTDMNKFQCRHI